MEVLYEVRGENLLIYLPEELDHHNAKTITEQSDWYIVSNQIKNIIFNFKRTMFMDSSGIGVIMGRYKLVKKRGGSITVTNINNSPRQALAGEPTIQLTEFLLFRAFTK